MTAHVHATKSTAAVQPASSSAPAFAPLVQCYAASPAAGIVPPIVHDVLRAPGQPLDPATRAHMEPRFGHDFSRVRVHSDHRAAQSADSVNALAYTVGQDVVFASGQYAPRTTGGGMLLAHELTHVVQQQHGRVSRPRANEPTVILDDRLEREAHDLGARVARGEFIDVPVQGGTGAMLLDRSSLGLQRKKTPPEKTAIYPTRRAYDFVPDHAFYEVLAHIFSYRNDLDGKFLYRAYQSLQQETTPVDPGSAAKSKPSLTGFLPRSILDLPGITGGIPARLEDNFAFMSTEPEIPPSIPYVGGEAPPLVYQVHLMPGSDLSKSKSGLVAYYLIPYKGNGPRIVAFRGTDPKAPDIAMDADQRGVGYSAFELHRGAIEKMLHAEEGRGKELVVVGHSLGGALAQWTAATFPGDVSAVVTFNSPGIGEKAATKFAAKKIKPKVSHYVTRGDIVSTAGESLLPGDVTMMEGNATRALEHMLESGSIKLAEDALMILLAVVSTLAKADRSFESRLSLILSVWLKLSISGGLAALERAGTLIGALHSQRLLRVNQLQSAPAEPPWSSIAYPGNKKWKPLADDVEALDDDTGQVTSTSKKPAEINLPSTEAARTFLSKAIGDVYALFNVTLPLISSLKKNMPATVALERLSKVGPVEIVAQQLEPLVIKLLGALSIVGGLSKLVEKALYYKPKPAFDYKAPLAEPDATKTKYGR